MIDRWVELTWDYLHALEVARIPLTVIALAMLVMVLLQPLRTIWLARLNYAILFQFAAMLVTWLVIAATGDQDFYYFIFNFLLITWTSLPLFVLAAIVPWFSRFADGSARRQQPR